MNKLGIIYILKDPENLEVRYVGQTIQKVGARYGGHLSKAKLAKGRISHVNSWIRNLINKNLKPIIEVVLNNIKEEDLDKNEIEVIKHYKQRGYNLCNHTEGGGGVRGKIVTKEETEKRLQTCKTSEAWKQSKINLAKILAQKRKEGMRCGYAHLPKEKQKEIIEKAAKSRCISFKLLNVNNEVLEFNSIQEACKILQCHHQPLRDFIYNKKIHKRFKDYKVITILRNKDKK